MSRCKTAVEQRLERGGLKRGPLQGDWREISSIKVRFCSLKECSFSIFRWRRMRPSRSASGGEGIRRCKRRTGIRFASIPCILKIGAVHPTAGSASAHRDTPFGFRHLVPDAFDCEGHFVSDGACDDHDIALTGRKAHDLGSGSGRYRSGNWRRPWVRLRQTSQTRGHGPERVFTHPVHSSIELRENHVPLDLRVIG